MKKSILFAILMFIAASAQQVAAEDINFGGETTISSGDVSFSNVDTVASVVLDSVVANSNINIELASNATYNNSNYIGKNAFQGSNGINSINQNTAPGSNVTQAIAVNYQPILDSLGVSLPQ